MPSYDLILQDGAAHIAAFDLRMDFETSKEANPALTRDDPHPSCRLFEIDFVQETLCVFPVVTNPKGRFLRQKYPSIVSISVDLPSGYEVPLSNETAAEFLRTYLPSGFISDPIYGLGVIKEMRPLITAIEKIPRITSIEILERGDTEVEVPFFRLSRFDYEDLRLAFQRIARSYQGESLADRNVLAHNEIPHRLMPDKFPAIEAPYKPGAIYKLLGGGRAGDITLRGQDRKAVVDAVANNARNLSKNDPKELVQLQKDLELVTLDQLIAAFSARLNSNVGERSWQQLFEVNPFILSMVFGYPVVLVSGGTSVGGMTLSGTGNKIADFLMKNSGTQNAALVEIKTAQTPLFGAEYRGGVQAPSKHVTGAIVQVLDQKQKFLTSLPTLKHHSGVADLQGYSVDCVILIGRTPTEVAEQSSFELFRSQLKDVRLVTFDELLAKLMLLRELLSGERYEGSHEELDQESRDLLDSALAAEDPEPEIGEDSGMSDEGSSIST